MAKLILLFVIAASSYFPVVHADDKYADEKHANVDLSSFTCDDFLHGIQSNEADKMHALVMWLEGYHGGISGNTIVNWHEVKEYKEDLITYCRKNGSHALLEAARRAGLD